MKCYDFYYEHETECIFDAFIILHLTKMFLGKGILKVSYLMFNFYSFTAIKLSIGIE